MLVSREREIVLTLKYDVNAPKRSLGLVENTYHLAVVSHDYPLGKKSLWTWQRWVESNCGVFCCVDRHDDLTTAKNSIGRGTYESLARGKLLDRGYWTGWQN